MKSYYQLCTVLQGDALQVLKTLPDDSVDMCMTSPPYWGLRNYHVGGQIGLEKTYQEYLDHLIEIFAEVKRIVRHTIWVNIADSYAGGKGSSSGYYREGRDGDRETLQHNAQYTGGQGYTRPLDGKIGIPAKSLIGIPERFSIAMIDKLGLIKRNNIIWFKRNCMPESVKDRFTKDFEPVYFYAKNKKYYFEQQFDEYTTPLDRWCGNNLVANGNSSWDDNTGQSSYRDRNMRPNNVSRNKRTMWDIPTSANGYEHYAAYPEKLCETPILAGCPLYICSKCGKPREKIYKSQNMVIKRTGWGASAGNRTASSGTMVSPASREETGLTDCGCGASFESGIVLDPFAGTGTTGAVAKRLGRKSVLIELNPKYCQIIEKRISKVPVPMELNL